MKTKRAGTRWCVVMLAAIAGCSRSQGPPETISFDRQPLTKATSWTRQGMSGVVYVHPGQTLPGAPLQVGAIVSDDHQTGTDLHAWVREQGLRSGQQFHNSGGGDESCVVAQADRRIYLSLLVCKTGVKRAACVEADEALDEGTVSSCLNTVGCFADVCEREWLSQREPLDLLAADVLSRR